MLIINIMMDCYDRIPFEIKCITKNDIDSRHHPTNNNNNDDDRMYYEPAWSMSSFNNHDNDEHMSGDANDHLPTPNGGGKKQLYEYGGFKMINEGCVDLDWQGYAPFFITYLTLSEDQPKPTLFPHYHLLQSQEQMYDVEAYMDCSEIELLHAVKYLNRLISMGNGLQTRLLSRLSESIKKKDNDNGRGGGGLYDDGQGGGLYDDSDTLTSTESSEIY